LPDTVLRTVQINKINEHKRAYNSLDEQLIVEIYSLLQIEFKELNDFKLKFHLSFFREVVGFVVFQYVHVPE